MSTRILFIGILLFAINSMKAQEVDTSQVDVTGYIIDEKTKEPVNAKIKYESLPYGSNIGIFKGNTFSFTIEKGTEILLQVEAEGYAVYSDKIITADSISVTKTVELQPTIANQIIRLEKLIFALGKAKITEESYQELDDLIAMLQANPAISIQLEGHTDFRGNDKLNMKLSEDRVEAVKDYLVNGGIDKKRISTKAFGGTQPLSRKSDAESRERNRRVEVRILAN